jgi:hypothetical protein
MMFSARPTYFETQSCTISKDGGITMKQKLPKLSEMEHITIQELSAHTDAICDRVIQEDIGLIIDQDEPSCVLCPADWFYDPKEIQAMIQEGESNQG